MIGIKIYLEKPQPNENIFINTVYSAKLSLRKLSCVEVCNGNLYCKNNPITHPYIVFEKQEEWITSGCSVTIISGLTIRPISFKTRPCFV